MGSSSSTNRDNDFGRCAQNGDAQYDDLQWIFFESLVEFFHEVLHEARIREAWVPFLYDAESDLRCALGIQSQIAMRTTFEVLELTLDLTSDLISVSHLHILIRRSSF